MDSFAEAEIQGLGSNLLKEEQLKTESATLVFYPRKAWKRKMERGIYLVLCFWLCFLSVKNQVHVIIYKIIKSTSLP